MIESEIYLVATTLDFVGKFLLASLVILVHNRVQKEGKIDREVLREMKLEKSVGSIALVLLILAYFVHLLNYVVSLN